MNLANINHEKSCFRYQDGNCPMDPRTNLGSEFLPSAKPVRSKCGSCGSVGSKLVLGYGWAGGVSVRAESGPQNKDSGTFDKIAKQLISLLLFGYFHRLHVTKQGWTNITAKNAKDSFSRFHCTYYTRTRSSSGVNIAFTK